MQRTSIRMFMAVIALAAMLTATGAVAGEGAYVLDYKMADIDGKEVDLEKYKGKVVMFVNVASKCGLTPQYADLVKLHEKYAEQGLAIVGFPANNFMRQEPGTNSEIKSFCTAQFGVEFDMMSKISVKGDDQADLYKELTSADDNGDLGGEIKWNFTKFLVGKDGKVVERFEPAVKPSAEEVSTAIEAQLAK